MLVQHLLLRKLKLHHNRGFSGCAEYYRGGFFGVKRHVYVSVLRCRFALKNPPQVRIECRWSLIFATVLFHAGLCLPHMYISHAVKTLTILSGKRGVKLYCLKIPGCDGTPARLLLKLILNDYKGLKICSGIAKTYALSIENIFTWA